MYQLKSLLLLSLCYICYSRLVSPNPHDNNFIKQKIITHERLSQLHRNHDYHQHIITSDANIATTGSSDMLTSIFNLAKTMIGSGILSLPAAVAAFSDEASSSLPIAAALLVAMGAISAYSFSSIGRACEQHKVKSFKEAWAASVDSKSGSAISLLITLKTLFSCLAFSIIIGDSFSSLLQAFTKNVSITPHHINIYGMDVHVMGREVVMMALTAVVVLPLCLQKSLDALKYTSILGLFGVVYCAVFMTIRLFDGSYKPGGRFYSQIAANMLPSFNIRGTVLNQKVFILLSTFATAYVAHYNAPKLYAELRHRSLSRYNVVAYSAFTFACVMYMAVMVSGFLTFGGGASGFILNNYAADDVLALLGRLAIGGGILGGYPLVFSALRDGFYDLLRFSEQQRERSRFIITVSMLVLITSIAIPLKNLGLVLSLSGALIGSALIYIIPAVMNINNIKKQSSSSLSSSSSSSYKMEMMLNYGIAVMGVAVAVIGVKSSLGH